MSEILSALCAKYLPVTAGLVAGSMAKFGRMLAKGEVFTWKHVLGHAMMMVMLGIFAVVVIDQSGITDIHSIAFVSAVLAVAASEVVQWLATRAWLRFVNEPNPSP